MHLRDGLLQCFVCIYHFNSSSFIADNQMNEACLLFADHYGIHIVKNSLCRNFLLHLISMHDFNLVNTQTIDQAMARLRLLQSQGAHRDKDRAEEEEEEEEEEDWETAVESQPELDPDPDLDPSEYTPCNDETSYSCLESDNQQREEDLWQRGWPPNRNSSALVLISNWI